MTNYQNAHIRRFSANAEREAGVTISLETPDTARVSLSLSGASDARAVLRIRPQDVQLLAVALSDAARSMMVPADQRHRVSSR
ncbi:hypothetical protein [Gemmatimonas sp.]|uniref:hypothetical protein n=1 Tax=Gemmatimonas sp. TaxID=1962908 RepID=UPI003DA45549